MSVVRLMAVQCDEADCTGSFPAIPDVWVDGPVRSAAGHAGWKYIKGRDLCPVHFVVACQIPS